MYKWGCFGVFAMLIGCGGSGSNDELLVDDVAVEVVDEVRPENLPDTVVEQPLNTPVDAPLDLDAENSPQVVVADEVVTDVVVADEPSEIVLTVEEQTLESLPSPFSAMMADDLEGRLIMATTRLQADGDRVGLSAYELIRKFGGVKPIESPDLYAINHPGEPHIYESSDPDVGDHFVFVIHRDHDRDRDKETITDRQRNEIKAYSSSSNDLKGFLNETMTYQWLFRVNSEMTVSKNFSHFFQLKAVSGDDSQPILTLTGRERNGEDVIEIRHSESSDTNYLGRLPWSEVTGEWLQVYVRATYAEQGSLRLILSRLNDDAVLFDVTEQNIDLWRGESGADFVRPKWGIYRSLRDIDNLRADEEVVDFADFFVQKVSW